MSYSPFETDTRRLTRSNSATMQKPFAARRTTSPCSLDSAWEKTSDDMTSSSRISTLDPASPTPLTKRTRSAEMW